jgi:P27 family predicted phage terminase small subunit
MPGRTPVPKSILEARGSWRARARGDEIKPANRLPTGPTILVGEARREWTRMGRILQTLGMAAEIDRAALAAYCVAWSDFVRLTILLKRTGDTVTTQQGNIVRHPAELARNKAEERLLRWADRFGMSPVARARLGTIVANDEPDADEARFLGTIG